MSKALVLALLVAILAAAVATAAEPRRARAAEGASRSAVADRCHALRRQLDRVDARLRAGYGAAEGRRLDARRRELREDLRYYACR